MERRGTAEELAKADPGELQDHGTQQQWGGKADAAHRLYSDEIRDALHTEIIKRGHPGHRTRQRRLRPDGDVHGGGGASGKSSILRSGQVEEPERSALLNADVLKECLPEFTALRDNPDDEIAKKAAAAVHEESSDLNKRLIRYAQLSGGNYVVDGTGDGKHGSLRKSLDAAREKGAETKVVFATTYVETAVDRAKARFEGPERRFVPEKHLYSAHQGATDNFLDMVKQSDHPVEVYDTSTKPPVLVFKREKGEGIGLKPSQIKDKDGYARFIARRRASTTRRANRRAAPARAIGHPSSNCTAATCSGRSKSGRVEVADLSPAQIKELADLRKKAA